MKRTVTLVLTLFTLLAFFSTGNAQRNLRVPTGNTEVGDSPSGNESHLESTHRAVTPGTANPELVEKLKEPKIVVKNIAVLPAPLKEGNPVTVIVLLKNVGEASSTGSEFRLSCTPPAGVKDCFVPDGTHSVKDVIQPGMTKSVSLYGAKPAAAGKYRVEVAVLPKVTGRPFTATFTVSAALNSKKAPLKVEDKDKKVRALSANPSSLQLRSGKGKKPEVELRQPTAAESAHIAFRKQQRSKIAQESKMIVQQMSADNEQKKQKQMQAIKSENVKTISQINGIKAKLVMTGSLPQPLVSELPEIVGHFGFTRPGGVVAIKGKHFGSQSGKVVLRFQDWKGSYQTVNTVIQEWHDELIGLILPWDLQGFMLQTARLQVVSAQDRKSNLYGFNFSPIEDYKEVSIANDSNQLIKSVACGSDGNRNRCNHNTPSSPSPCAGAAPPLDLGAAIDGYHSNCWGTYGEDDGTDVYEISLQNGWTLQSRTVKIHKSGNDTWDYVHGPTPDFSISPHWNPAFEWSVTSNDEVRYKVWITIAGPKGVPYK